MVAAGIPPLIWMDQIHTQDLLVLFVACLFCLLVPAALFGGALAVLLNPPTRPRFVAITIGGMIVFLITFCTGALISVG
jgi:hypothetical protein